MATSPEYREMPRASRAFALRSAKFTTLFPFAPFLFILISSLPKGRIRKISVQEQTLEDFRSPDRTAHRFLKVEHDFRIERNPVLPWT